MTTDTATKPGTAPSGWSRLRAADPLTAVVCAVALGVYLPHGFDGYLSRDLGLYSYGGQLVAEGVPPYVGTLNRVGPLGQLIPGFGAYLARAVGADDLLGMRVLFLLLTVACIGVAYLLGRDVFRSRGAGLACAAALLSFHGVITYATYGPREKTSLLLFVLCTLLAITHQKWATTGFFIALATLTWQPVLLPALGGVLVAVALGLRTGRATALLRVTVGGLVPLLVTLGMYAAAGALDVFWDNFLLINLRYTEQVSLSDEPAEAWDFLVVGYGWSIWVFLVGSVAVFGECVAGLVRRSSRRDPGTATLAAAAAVLVLGGLWSLQAFNGWPDNFFALPSAALGIGGLVAALRHWASPAAVRVAVVGWVVAATALSLSFSIGERDDRLDEQRADVAAAMRLLPPDTRILSVSAPQPLVLAHERNLTRLQIFSNGLTPYLDDTWRGGREGYARWIARRAPNVIATGGYHPPEWLLPTLDGAYQCVGKSAGWFWHVRTDLGAPTLRQLSRLLDASACTSLVTTSDLAR
jgi:hypothetical protein